MDERKIYFNSSLPRSGSTLLQNILAQNPRFYCSATSGVIALLYAARLQFADFAAFKSQDAELMQRGFRSYCARALTGFYEGITDKPVCVDKSRTWLPNYEWLCTIVPRPRIVCCVRDLRGIVSSLEKLWRRNQAISGLEESGNNLGMMSLPNRVMSWIGGNPVGIATMTLVDLLQRGLTTDVHVVRFEDLTARPRETIDKVYAYLGEAPFGHDFENVEQLTHEDDAQLGAFADHNVRRRVEPAAPDWNDVLGRDLANHVAHSFGAYYAAFYPGVR